ncbi:hypothetical protein HYN56_24665 [Flavobacterium crocinum]|uniref:O-antigen ligase domain-containing protein n=1 Tax=Flavobacterium crocinum TaxID=2183896 RepID=A0A2S1YT19_9FLAO|nr:O-antigen ligase family protein [Flavobacterium crocinum]AWK07247.1 hypothetical protein HYN56_24665 [Flavobacterium crocinum]
MYQTRNTIGNYLFWLFPLIGYQFFQYTGFEKEIGLVVVILFLIFSILYCKEELFFAEFKNKTLKKYKNLTIWIFICTLFCPLLFWGQNIFLNFRISVELYRYIFLFLLLKIAISEKKIVKFIDFYFIIHLLLKIAYIKFSLVGYFGFSNIIEDDNRGFIRPRIEGVEFAVLAFFMHLNGFVIKKKWKDLIFIVLAYLAILLTLTRQYIFYSAILGVIFVFKSSRYKFILILITGVFLYILPDLILKTQLPVVKDLVAISQDQYENNNDSEKDIRLVAAEYFVKDFNETVTPMIFGNGLPHAYSEYGKKMIYQSENKALYSNDVGYVHIFLYSGIMGLLLFLLVFYKLLKYPVFDNYLWCKFYLVYILFTNIASQTMSICGISISVVAYLILFHKKNAC